MAAATSKKIKVGRPSDYKPEYAQRALELLYNGASKVQLCREFMVHRDTIDHWENTIKEFSDAVECGCGYSEGYWIGMGHDNLNNKDFNTRLYELNMMNRFGWNKKTEGKQEIKLVPHDEMLKELT